MSSNNHLVAVADSVGDILLYDMYRGGEWVGSRRTLSQCRLALGDYDYIESSTITIFREMTDEECREMERLTNNLHADAVEALKDYPPKFNFRERKK